MQGAQALIDSITGTIPGVTMKIKPQASAVLMWCDEEVWPWHLLGEMGVSCWTHVREALRALARTDDATRRAWLLELGHSIRRCNLDELRDRALEVLRADRAGELPDGRPLRERAVKAFTPTGQVTEASVEYDFLDPAYAAGEMPWDDRCAADLEPSDDCPF